MRFVVLHDHLNPATEIEINADAVVSVTPFGSGSTIQLQDADPVGVHETPQEVERILNG